MILGKIICTGFPQNFNNPNLDEFMCYLYKFVRGRIICAIFTKFSAYMLVYMKPLCNNLVALSEQTTKL